MTSRRLIIAIDGPSGAGKGTVARTIASRLNYRHIDTGAMYRAVAWLALHDGIDLQDEARVASVARSAALELEDGVRANGHEVSSLIRTPEKDIYQVRSGNYIGQDFGVIVGISDTDVKLRELVQDGAGDWTERTSSLQLQQQENNPQGRKR